MSKTLDCPICDLTLQLPDLEMVTGASGIAVPTQDSIAKLTATEATMTTHVGEHSAEEVMEAFVKADVYIAGLEQDLARVRAELDDVREQVRSIAPAPPTRVGSLRHPVTFAEEVHATEQAIVAREIAEHDPDATLIPHLSSAARPEGAVGRKT